MTSAERIGRLSLSILIGWNLTVDLLMTALDSLFAGGDLLTEGIVRFILNAALSVMLFKGYSWARWLVIIFSSLAAIVLGIQLVVLDLDGAFMAVLMAAFLGAAFMSVGLLLSGQIKSFLRRQREGRTKTSELSQPGA